MTNFKMWFSIWIIAHKKAKVFSINIYFKIQIDHGQKYDDFFKMVENRLFPVFSSCAPNFGPKYILFKSPQKVLWHDQY
jgi:hypothetical protein